MCFIQLSTSDNAGNNVAVPSLGYPEHLALLTRIVGLHPGTRRGGITNASAPGFVDAEGEFKSTVLNEGLCDTLYSIKC